MNLKAADHKDLHYASIMQNVRPNDGADRHIFLGNGFNMAIGVNTSYDSLQKSLLRHVPIRNLLEKYYKRRVKDIKKFPHLLEKHIARIKCKAHRDLVKEVLYKKILERCKSVYKYEETVAFLRNFQEYYTTNYDPLLYLFLLSRKEEEVKKDAFYLALEKIYKNWIVYESNQINPELKGLPVKVLTKKQIYEVSSKIFRENDMFPKKRKDDYYKALKFIREEEMLKIDDGFHREPVGREKIFDIVWNEHIAKGKHPKEKERKQKIFYLHGALHFYRDGENDRKIRKKVMRYGSGFINHLLNDDIIPVCVFDGESTDKWRSIRTNDYLKHCSERLGQISGDLFILGWSLSPGDTHLAKIIKNNRKIDRLVVSFHGKPKNVRDFKSRYSDFFENKNVVFFDIQEADFCKKRAKKAKPPGQLLEK